jgi:putative oxidoreductase
MKKYLFLEFIPSLLILLFVYTAISKLADIHTFEQKLTLFPVLKYMNVFTAWLIPTLELAIASLLFFPKTRLFGLYSTLILLSIFTIYLVLMLVFGDSHLPCTCGGVIRKLTWKQHLFFNLFFILITGLSILKRSNPSQTKPFVFKPSN